MSTLEQANETAATLTAELQQANAASSAVESIILREMIARAAKLHKDIADLVFAIDGLR